MLRVDVEGLELTRVVVLHGAEVLAHGRVALVVVWGQEWDQRVGIAQLAVVRLLDVELVEPGAQHAWVPVGRLHGVEEAVVAERVQRRDHVVRATLVSRPTLVAGRPSRTPPWAVAPGLAV